MAVDKSLINEQLKSRKGKFSQVPNEIWDIEIEHLSRTVWMYLLAQGPHWKSSINNLAKNLGIHKDTAIKHVKDLESKNMMEVNRSSKGTSFTILPPSMWNATTKNNRQPRENVEAAQKISCNRPNLYPISGPSGMPEEAYPEGSIQYSNINTFNTAGREGWRNQSSFTDYGFFPDSEESCNITMDDIKI